jgi:hypothetical protein
MLYLQDAMVTAFSLDKGTVLEELPYAYGMPHLSVNFLCMDQVADKHRHVNGRTLKPRAARFQESYVDPFRWHALRYSSYRFFLDDRFHSNLDNGDKKLKSKESAECKAS